MTNRKPLIALGLGLLFLVLKADSCIIEDRMVDAVVTQTIPYVWHTEGDNAAGSDSAVVSLAADVEAALDEFEGDVDVTAIHISGGTYRVLENRGFVGAHMGTVTIQAVGDEPLTILTYDVPNPPGNADGASGGTGVDVSLVAAGINLLNERLAEYLDTRDPSRLQFTFRTEWNSTAPSTDYDFDWETALILQVVGTIEVQVPNP
ncbi:MAG TPA: hypothetical protein VF720_14640 [Candidatus Eisenbacteria bacterium]